MKDKQCLSFIRQVPSLLDAVMKTTKISKALQATRGGPADGSGTVWSYFGTVAGYGPHQRSHEGDHQWVWCRLRTSNNNIFPYGK